MPRPSPIRMKAARRAPGFADQASAMLGLPSGGRAPDPSHLPRPRAGELTGSQGTLVNPGIFPVGVAGGYGGFAGGMGFAGMQDFASLWQSAFPGMPFSFAGSWWQYGLQPGSQIRKAGGYVPYRLMDLDPTLRLVYSLIVGPILASTWTIKPREGVALSDTGDVATRTNGRVTAIPKAWADCVSDQVLPLRQSVLPECLRYLRSGWRPFERVYQLRPGPSGRKVLWLTKLKPLLPDTSVIVDGGAGNFGGVIATGGTLDSRKSWICSNDVEAGNLYGMSRHEGAFQDWMEDQYAGVRMALLAVKLSGTLPIIYYRPGATPINGKPKDNSDIARSILATLQIGNGVVCPTTEYEDSELQQNPDLAKLAPWKLDIVNAGTYAPAISGMIEERNYHDVRKIRAWGWPERAVIESQGASSKADSETHSDAASSDRELIDSDLAAQLSGGQPLYDVPGVIDEIVALNFDPSPDMRGVLAIHPAPLVDSKAQVYTQLLDAVFSDPQLATPFASVVNWPDLLSHLDIATTDDLKEKLPQLLSAAAEQQRQQAEAQTASTRAAVTAATSKTNKITVPGKPGQEEPYGQATQQQQPPAGTAGKPRKRRGGPGAAPGRKPGGRGTGTPGNGTQAPAGA